MKNKQALFFCTLLLVFLFVYTGSSKLMDLETFRGALRNQPFPAFTIPVLLWLVPVSELVIAGLLVFDATRWWGLLGAFALMLLFTGYVVLVMLHVFYKIPCTCGGVIRHFTWPQHLLFNLFFLLVSLLSIKIFMHENRVSRKPV